MHQEGEKKAVAVVGTGMAGLVIAFLLTRDPDQKYEVEVFENVCAKPTSTLGERDHLTASRVHKPP